MRHIPVLLEEAAAGLNLSPGAKVVDCTVGDGGHAQRILRDIGERGRLLAMDADPESLLRAKNFLHKFDGRALFVRANFRNLSAVLADEKFGKADGILIDLGWSSQQFAERGRGFSFQSDEPLDMRYAPIEGGQTAADILNSRTEKELSDLFAHYGEEKLSREIARGIVERRKKEHLSRTGGLTDTILSAYRKKLRSSKEIPWVGGLHPATKVFQALRIAVNDELGALKSVLPQAAAELAPGGRLAVISFHSLEDGIVKHFFKSERTLSVITKKPITAGMQEAADNPKARSAKLRIAQKL